MISPKDRNLELAMLNIAGATKNCPACHNPIVYADEIKYNGDGPPPSSQVQCGDCGCAGPFAQGSRSGDHIGSILNAIALWNNMPRRVN